MLVNLSPLTPAIRTALRNLVDEITSHDGISPINESANLGIDGLRVADFFLLGGRVEPKGFVICDERDETLMLGVHPEHRKQGIATALLTEALSNYPTFATWAFGTLPGVAQLASRVGLAPVRELLRMERELTPQDDSWPAAPHGYELVAYSSEFREELVALNAEAFADHPEQGRLTVSEFDDLTKQPWFDPNGLFLALHDGKLAGFHWTKRHPGQLGEVYVIAVSPQHEGKGLGRSLLQRGIAQLRSNGDQRVQLYVEAASERVVKLYLSAGFEIAQTDTSFRAKRG